MYPRSVIWPAFSTLIVACTSADTGSASRSPAGYTLGTAEVVVGSATDEDVVFSNIRAVSADADGRILVGESRSPRVLLLNSSGELIREVGRLGEGPGEYRTVSYVGFAGGDPWVLDSRSRRATVFRNDTVEAPFYPVTTDRHPARSARVPTVAHDGRAVLATDVFMNGGPGVSPEPGGLFLADSTGLVQLATLNVDHVTAEFADTTERGITSFFYPQPFTFRTHWDAVPGGDGFALVDSDSIAGSYTVTVIDLSGDTLWSVRESTPLLPLTDAVVDSVASSWGPTTLFTARQFRAGIFSPSSVPPVSAVRAANLERVWVARERVPGVPTAWDVVTPRGLLMSVEVPSGFDLRVPLEDGAWGIEIDEFDVQSLVKRPLRRLERSPSK